MVFDWVRERPFSYSNWAGWNKRAERLRAFADNPHCPALVGEDSRKGQMEGGRGLRGGVTERVLSDVPAGHPHGIAWCWRDVWPAVSFRPTCFFFLPNFLPFLRCHLATEGLVGQPAVSVPNCHRHCLSVLTGWTDDGHVNGRNGSALQKHSLHMNCRYSSPGPSTFCFVFFVFSLIHM